MLYRLSGKGVGRAAFPMATEKREAVKRLGLRSASAIKNDVSEEVPSGFRLEAWRVNRAGARR